MIRFLNLLSNIVDPNWCAVVGKKSGLYALASKPNKFKEWKLKQPLWKQLYRSVDVHTFSISI